MYYRYSVRLLAVIINFNDSGLYSQLETLNDREKEVLKLRFGLEDGTPKTLEQVAKLIVPKIATINKQNTGGITRERVRQIEAKAIRKLRHPIRMRYILPNFYNQKKIYIEEINRLNLLLKEITGIKIQNNVGSLIQILNLPTRIENALLAKNIIYIEQLLLKNYSEMMKIKNISSISVQFIEQKLSKHLGYKFLFNYIN